MVSIVIQDIQNDNQSQKEVTNNTIICNKSKPKSLVRPRGLFDFIVLKFGYQLGKQGRVETEGMLDIYIT